MYLTLADLIGLTSTIILIVDVILRFHDDNHGNKKN